MILVFGDDQTVQVLADLEAVRRECEVVDIQQGVYRFFTDLGEALVPRIDPPREGQLLGGLIRTVTDGRLLALDVDPQGDGDAVDTALSGVVALDPNPWFSSVADLMEHVHTRRPSG